MLDNRKPANAADLAALTFEYLREISRNILDGNTSDWHQYWNVDPHNRPQSPKPEAACRDALLSDFQIGMSQLGIDALKEGPYADDKRSDIRVSCGGFNVPVEIKKSCHRDLWSAIKTQLIAKYTRSHLINPGKPLWDREIAFSALQKDPCSLAFQKGGTKTIVACWAISRIYEITSRDPGADGYGIYLVFWFGNTEHCRPTPGPGSLPKNADELKNCLNGTLSAEERRRIPICVIDVSKPEI